MAKTVLLDESNTWSRVPYMVRWGDKFSTLRDSLKARVIDGFSTASNEHILPSYLNLGYDKVLKDFGLTPDQDKDGNDIISRPYFRDTRVGGNDAINCTWQFCKDDDIIYPVTSTEPYDGVGMNNGLGRVYATTTEPNSQICWFTFGVPFYTALATFYKNSFNDELIELNNSGTTSVKLGAIFAGTFKLAVHIVLLPIRFLGYWSKSTRNRYPVNRFYELRACMPLYYKYVDSILAEWLIGVGLYNNGNPNGDNTGLTTDPDDRWDKKRDVKFKDIYSDIKHSNSWTASPEYVPDALRATGASIWDILRRRALVVYGHSADSAGSYEAFSNTYKKYMDATFSTDGNGEIVDSNALKEDWRKKYESYLDDQGKDNSYGTGGSTAGSSSINPFSDNGGGDWAASFESSALGASQFIGFKITKGVDASESFSNSTSPSSFAEQFNSKVRETTAMKNNLAVGGESTSNTGIDFLDTIINSGAGLLKGTIDALGNALDIGVADMAKAVVTGAYIDIPEMYDSSSFSTSHSINLQLRSPYGDYISIYQSIIVPLALLLAGSLPRAGGSDSYMQPFLCRCYCKGMFSIPMGIIDSLSIRRGSSEFGWTYNNLPTCIDVSLSIKDMSPIMYLQINDDYFQGLFVQDNAFKEYMLTLSGLGLWERISMFARIRRNMQYTAHKLRNQLFNPAYWSKELSDLAPVRMVSSLVPISTVSRR